MTLLKNIFFAVLALVLIACMGVFLFFQTFDTDQYLPKLTAKISSTLGRKVTIGHVGLGLCARGITLDAWPLIIADDPDFTSEPFIHVDRVRLSVDLRTLVFRHEVRVNRVVLESPEIHFIRSEDARLNTLSLAKSHRVADGGPAVAIAATVPAAPKPEPVKAMPAINIKSIKIEGGTISYIDQGRSMPLDIWLSGINATVRDFSFARPFRFLFEAALYSDEPNLQANALISLDPANHLLTISNLSVHADLFHLDYDGLKDISPGMPQTDVLKNVSGAIQLNMPSLDLGTPGDFKANGELIITKGTIKRFNVIQTVLAHTLGSFGIEIHTQNFFKGALKDKLAAPDTFIDKADAKFAFHDKTLFINDSSVKTNIFEFTAKGSMGQAFNMDMQTVLHFNDDISAGLVDQFGGLKYLMDDSKRISIDAELKGIFPHLNYKPSKDFRKKSRKAFMEEGGRILGVLF